MVDYIENIQMPDGTVLKINTVPVSGETGQVLAKKSDNDNDLEWITPTQYDDTQVRQDISGVQDDIVEINNILDTKQSTLVDTETVAVDETGLNAIGTLERNKGEVKFDWVGTLAEWEAGRADKSILDSYICFVIDD